MGTERQAQTPRVGCAQEVRFLPGRGGRGVGANIRVGVHVSMLASQGTMDQRVWWVREHPPKTHVHQEPCLEIESLQI